MEIIAQDLEFDNWINELPKDFEFERSAALGIGRDFAPGMPYGKDYQAKIWRFPGGKVEITTSRIDSIDRMAHSRYWLAGCPVKFKAEEEVEESSEEELKRKEADNRSRAVRRATQNVRRLVYTIEADHLLTLNYRANMTDVEQLKRDWDVFVRSMHARYPDWEYVAIREAQERGSLHLHVAVKGRQDIKYIRRCWYKALGASPDAQGEETPGQIDVRPPWKRFGKGYRWEPEKLCGYLSKYLGKAFAEVDQKNAKRYWQPKSVQLPEPVKIWLGATSFVDAIVETHGLVGQYGGEVNTMWASQGYESIWMTG